MEFTSTLNFFNLIAFILPGFVAIFPLRQLSYNLDLLINVIFSNDAKITHLILVIIIALIVGLIISATRNLVLDNVQFWTGIKKQETNYSKLDAENKLKLYKSAVNNIYRYCQFYGNMLISLLVYLYSFIYKNWNEYNSKSYTITIIVLIVAIILFINHRSSLQKMQKLISDVT